MTRLLGFLGLWFGWLFLAFLSTVGGAFLVMLFADWGLDTLLASSLAWPVLGLAAIAAVPISMIGIGRIYLSTALGGGLLFNLVMMLI